MEMPEPTAKDIARLKALYERRFSVTLNADEAHELTTRLVRLHFIKAHAILPLCQKEL